jgi:trigger factor
MRVEVQELEPCKRQLVVEAPETEVAAAWEAAYGRVQRQARLPGFRRGKVPRSLVRVHFADEVRRAVAEQLIPDTYRRALDETRLDPVEDPEVREVHLEEGQPLRFTAVVEIRPTIALGTYRGVSVRHTPRPLAEAEVEGALAALAERHATLTMVARPVRVGDFVLVDYVLEPEGQEPRREHGYGFLVGGSRVLPEMDETVIGLEPGDERTLGVRFPETHPREELRGRTGRLWLRLVEVKEKEVPSLDDDFARAHSAFQTLGELRQAVRADLERGREAENQRARDDAVVEALLAAHGFAVPEGLVLREIAHRITQARESLARQGVDPEAMPWDYRRLTEELRPTATRAVRRALLLDAIADREEIAVSDAEVDAEIERLGRESGRAPQAVRSLLQRGGDLEGLRSGLRVRKTLAFLVEHAHIQAEA